MSLPGKLSEDIQDTNDDVSETFEVAIAVRQLAVAEFIGAVKKKELQSVDSGIKGRLLGILEDCRNAVAV